SISMLISIFIWLLFMKLQENRQRKKVQQERIHVYLEYLSQIVTRIHKEKEAIHIYCSQTFPMLEECLMRIKKKQLLWSMDPLDPSFLTIRLGNGNIPLDLNVHFPSYSVVYKKDMILDKLENIKKDIYIQENTPVLISLQTFWKVGIVGDYARVYTYSLVLQLCALYKYTDVNVLLIIDEQDEEAYQLRWLPHITNYVSMKRLLIKGKKHEWKMNSHLMEIFHKQKEKDSFSSYFIIVDFTKDRTLEIVNIILSNKKYHGFSYIQVASSYDELDHRLSTVVQLDKEKGILRKQEGMSPIYFQIDYVNKHEVYEGCRQLANIQLKRHHKESSQSLSFLTLFGVEKVEQLDIVQRWASFSNMSLQTPLGTDINGEIIYLDVHEKAHGPHGLFAGMTGSGKSECLITYLLSLCVNYHPDFIGIVLIDYKGGGTSLSLADLPHMQGVITNLDHGEAERYLKSIECEIIRRQKIFHHIVNSLKLREIDIDQYHTLYQQKVVKEAIPHLLIVCDEFAELKRQQPEFMEQLISASRIGRSLGIHLLLATQKPAGVVDEQIWSNTRFRICLKVADRCDSMDMIKREDAVYLQKAGSFYFQVGHNEVFLKGQTAWAKAPYRSVQEKNKKLYAIDAKGDIIYEYKFSSYKEEAQLSYIIDYILKFAKKEKIQKKEIWKPCLPKHLKREDIFYTIEEHEQFRVVIGKVDDVERQCYQKLSISVLEEKQIVLLGNDSESKTIFLIALLYEYIRHYSKEELQIYIVDFENASLQIFQQAPQIIDILFTYDVYKIKTMMDYLKKIIMERKGCDTRPLLLVILHNYALLKEYDNTFDFELMHLIREGGKVGISIVITANTSSELSYRVMQYIQHYYVFQLQDSSEYCSIFQTSRVKKIPAYPGRGLYKKDSIYEFQVHHIDKEDIGRSEKFRKCEVVHEIR
ncbi:MAG: hypothetical protein K2L08_00445, partial [Erysipelotrichaceae bacterium]|nr:hypothetical protein [Erysipelotrichaceae bacterium]